MEINIFLRTFITKSVLNPFFNFWHIFGYHFKYYINSNKMSKNFILAILFCISAIGYSNAQNNVISGALNTGNTATLSTYIDTHVSITILDNENTYTKQQAEMILRDFFAKHPAKSYSTVHEGTSPEGSKFTVGTLVTANGNFRTFFLIKQKDASFTIQEIRFEAQ